MKACDRRETMESVRFTVGWRGGIAQPPSSSQRTFGSVMRMERRQAVVKEGIKRRNHRWAIPRFEFHQFEVNGFGSVRVHRLASGSMD
jgi:hypothetical protein